MALWLLPLLTLLASTGPTLTFLRLFQIKEWRWDRLGEHLRREGISGITGTLRPVFTGIGIMLAFAGGIPHTSAAAAVLIALIALGAVQATLGRQKCPVWTQKAVLITALSFALILCAAWIPLGYGAAFIPVLSPIAVLAAWALLLPVDFMMKRRILAQAMRLRARMPGMTVIGVTGSVGKTTTKELVAHILEDRGALRTTEHVNTELGIAQWMLRECPRRKPGILVAEMGAYRAGEIALLCDILRPSIGIVTAVGRQHLALFGSEEAIRNAKGELIAALPEDGLALLNADDPGSLSLRAKARCPVRTVGTGEGADLRAERVADDDAGLRFRLGNDEVHAPLRGKHNVVNVLLAIAAAEHLGVPRATAIKRLANAPSSPRTFAVRTEGGLTILEDTYNSGPLSVAAAIAWAAERPERPRTLLLSPLLELGTEESSILRDIGARCRGVIDRIVLVSGKERAALAEGFGSTVVTLDAAAPVPSGGLLLCCGRMTEPQWRRLLPSA